MATENRSAGQQGRPPALDFYTVDASVLSADARQLLQEYSKVPNDQINQHVESIRKMAFAIFPYPCIGMFRFLDLSLSSLSLYPDIVKRLQGGETFLDLGCCFGQEIRKLIHDGAPASNLYGSDLRPEFIELGYQLFGDKDTLKSKFIPSDIFQDDSDLLSDLSGKIDIIYTGSFFHLFELEEQKAVARQVVKLQRPKAGGLIIGRQVSNLNAREFRREGYPGEKGRFRHNEESWKNFWADIGQETGISWDVKVTMDDLWMGENWPPEARLNELRGEGDVRRMKFVVKRL